MKNITMSIETARELYKIEANKKWLLENFTQEELEPRELVRSWEEAFNTKKGYYIGGTNSRETEISDMQLDISPINYNIFRTRQEAFAYGLAAAQLSQIISDANGDWEADYTNHEQFKFGVRCTENKLVKDWSMQDKIPFPMKSAEIRDACLEKHRGLWEQFWMITKD